MKPGRAHVRQVSLLAGLLLLLLAPGCARDPSANYLGGIGDPVRGAALYAPRNLGDTSRWAGQPAEAAVAAEQLEFLTNELQTNPRYAPEVNPAVTQQLAAARAEMRGFLGIAPTAPPEPVIEGLRRAAAALRAGNRAGAEAALSGPSFTAGPLVTLARLNAMPRLPRTAEAAGAVAAELDRLDRRR
ncbi:hypothetical protein [Siccirubricoccus sp. G192]|uniref:hypothetical protein n=1 Tax=Siccirubricoccus sp. G192 TaxID=2849651 RepID=UPI001C2BACBD|nr:hypothetical protein [Siccirubricoccus sp. G192]MBV1798024.1 hypothetical protein [Siccirubricoccus sp. G192]